MRVSISKGKRKKEVNTHPTISGQNKIQTYLTKTWTKQEDNTHKHQTIPQTSTEYFKGTSGENHREAIHSFTDATNKHKTNCEQGSKTPETSKLSSVPASIQQYPVELSEDVCQGTRVYWFSTTFIEIVFAIFKSTRNFIKE